MPEQECNQEPLDIQSVEVWKTVYWAELERRLTPFFARSETRRRVLAYIVGLLSPAERKNGWQLAEITGDVNPYGFQHLLGRANWDADEVCVALRRYCSDYLAEDETIGVIDETGFLKKGRHSVGVARQYSGTAGRIENCQIGVMLCYATTQGHTLIDRELYIPAEWSTDATRSEAAGIPSQRCFASKPQLALQMLQRSAQEGITFTWIVGDCVYGDSSQLRLWLEERHQQYVFGVSGKGGVWLEHEQQTITQVLESLPSQAWSVLSAGEGSKGPRTYGWYLVELASPEHRGWKRCLLVRKSLVDEQELRAFLVFSPQQTTLEQMVRAIGMRWTVEESIQIAKGEVGLDHYEVRSWHGWYRHITLAFWAQTFLNVIRKEMGDTHEVTKKKDFSAQESSLAAFKQQRGLSLD